MRTNIATAQATRPNRILVILAAAWMILSLAIGGAVTADGRADASDPGAATVTTISQP